MYVLYMAIFSLISLNDQTYVVNLGMKCVIDKSNVITLPVLYSAAHFRHISMHTPGDQTKIGPRHEGVTYQKPLCNSFGAAAPLTPGDFPTLHIPIIPTVPFEESYIHV